MANLTLPEIQPMAQDIDPGARQIEQAGAQFNQALGQTAQVFSDLDKARILTEQNEAAARRKAEIGDWRRAVNEKLTFSPDEVRDFFGADPVPPELERALKAEPEGLPTHRVAPHLFPTVERRATERAAAGIEGPGWKDRFRQHTRELAINERNSLATEMSDLERARLTVANKEAYQRAKSAGDVAGMESAIRLMPDVLEQERHSQAFGADLRDVGVRREYNAPGTPDEQVARLQVLQAEVMDNQFGTPMSQPEQAGWAAAISGKIKAIKDAQYQQRYEAQAGKLTAVNNLPPGQRRLALTLDPFILPPDHGLESKDARGLLEWADKLMKGEDVTDEPGLFAGLIERDWERLKTLSLQQVQRLESRLSPTTYKEVARAWGDMQEGRKPPSLTDREYAAVEQTLDFLKYAPAKGATPEEALRRSAAREELILRYYRQRDPAKNMVAQMVDLGRDIHRGVQATTWKPGTQGYLQTDLESSLVTQQVLRFQGKNVSKAAERTTLAEVSKALPAIKDAWSAANPDSPPDSTALAQVYFTTQMKRAELTKQAQDEWAALEAAAAERAKAAGGTYTPRPVPKTFKDEVLYPLVIDANYTAPESRETAEAARAEAFKRRENEAANAQAAVDNARQAAVEAAKAKEQDTLDRADYAAYRAKYNAEVEKPRIFAGQEVYAGTGPDSFHGWKAKIEGAAKDARQAKSIEAWETKAKQDLAWDKQEYEDFLKAWDKQHPPTRKAGIEIRNDPPSFESWRKAKVPR